jgi:hypothetical protein
MITMTGAAEPPGRRTDPMLWRSAQRVLERHRARLSQVGGARCNFCAESWPCPSAVEAARATVIAGGPPADLDGLGSAVGWGSWTP